jgi:predicted cation transporter
MLEGIALHIVLGALMGVVLFLPFLWKRVEEELEAFIMVIGLAAVTTSGLWNWSLVATAAEEPIAITIAVLAAGFVFYYAHSRLTALTTASIKTCGLRLFVFIIVTLLGLLSSVMTAMIAAAVLSVVVGELGLERRSMIKVTVVGCFAIGLGAALTPVGEPLSTIVVSKLSGEPYHAGSLFLLRHLGIWIIPSVLVMGVLAGRAATRGDAIAGEEEGSESVRGVLGRGLRTYIFVAGLVLLAEGLRPLVDTYIVGLPHGAIYWINISSAALDNATLAAAEISHKMDLYTIKSATMGLLAAGGILIPGNIPNIICAGKLGIKSKEWARFGVPLGITLMALLYVAMALVDKLMSHDSWFQAFFVD